MYKRSAQEHTLVALLYYANSPYDEGQSRSDR